MAMLIKILRITDYENKCHVLDALMEIHQSEGMCTNSKLNERLFLPRYLCLGYAGRIFPNTFQKKKKIQSLLNGCIRISLSIFLVNIEILHCTVVSHYYDTAEVTKKYHNIQTIELSSINF